MIYEPKVSEEYDLDLCLYYYKCALDAKHTDAADSQLDRLNKIILKAISEGRLDSYSQRIFQFLVDYPDLHGAAKKYGISLRGLVLDSSKHHPYAAANADVLRMLYY